MVLVPDLLLQVLHHGVHGRIVLLQKLLLLLQLLIVFGQRFHLLLQLHLADGALLPLRLQLAQLLLGRFRFAPPFGLLF